MTRAGTFLLLTPTLACVSHLPTRSSALGERMASELVGDGTAETPARASLDPRDFIFVAGFLNEAIPGYFIDNEAVVHDEFSGNPSTLFPPATASIDEDVQQIHAAVLERFTKDHKPVVLVGHSKGGAAVVLCVLRHPELILSGKVDRVISIQGAFGGSPLADSLSHLGPVHAIPEAFRGLESLKTATMKGVFASAIESLRRTSSPQDFDRLSWRVFYVRSWDVATRVSPELFVTNRYLSGFGSGHNDGLVLAESQKLDGFGVDLGVLPSDHASLTVSSPLSNSTARERKAFTRALLAEVFSR